MEVIIFIVVIVLIIVLVVAGNSGKKNNNKNFTAPPVKPPEPIVDKTPRPSIPSEFYIKEKTADSGVNPTITINPANTVKTDEDSGDGGQKVTTLMIYDKRKSANKWVCVNCESENSMADVNCVVCSHKNDNAEVKNVLFKLRS